MKHLLIVISICLLLTAFLGEIAYANTGEHYMRIGRLWVNAEYDGAEGWGGQYAWPGGRIRKPGSSSIRELWGANVRKLGSLAGVKNWTGPNGTVYPYWTSGMYRTYDYDYLPYWKDQTHQTALYPVTQILYQRWAQPNVFVDGTNITPDGGANFTEVHVGDFQHDANTAVKEDLITERAIKSVWRYSMGVEYERWMYGYSNVKHQDYVFYDITLTNNGKVFGLPGETPLIWPEEQASWPHTLTGQNLEGFWWAQTGNPWNSGLGRSKSFGADDAVGEFIQPFAADGDESRFYMFYDGDHEGDGVSDWADPSIDEQFVELLSPAWIAWGALNEPTNSTVIRQERDYDLGKVVKTMQDQYEAQFSGEQWPLDTPHREVNPAVKKPSGYTAYGPYDLAFGESVNLAFVVAAGGMSHDLAVEYGQKAWDAGNVGPVMDEIKELHMTGRDSVIKTLELAKWNAMADKGGHARYDVPDAPRPPANFWVKADGPKIAISWSDESRTEPDFDTGVVDFAGYRVYRATGARDSVYRQIYDGTGNEFVDTNVSPGFQYFYYVAPYDDGSQNWEDPGVSIEGGKYYCWTGWAPEGVSPASAPIEDGSALENIRVVPNPYSAAGKTFPGEDDKIVWTGLPAECTIKIFTTNGDFVHEIVHNDGSGTEDWNLRTEYNQFIVSDVYIYTVDCDLGDYVGKFIVIR